MNAAQKIEMVEALRKNSMQNTAFMGKTEQFVVPERGSSSSFWKTLRFRIALAILLFVCYAFCDRMGYQFFGISTEQIFNCLNDSFAFFS